MQRKISEKTARNHRSGGKRKAIGTEFIRVFEEESAKLGNFDFLAQGTLYSDVIESAVVKRGKGYHSNLATKR